jgi:hypothetical protein
MAAQFAFHRRLRPVRLTADGVAPWLDQVGMPLVLAGAVVVMLLTIAG